MPGYKHPCRYCQKLIPPDSNTCPFCSRINPLGPLRCPVCRNPIQRDWQKCSGCGLNLGVYCPACGKATFFADYCELCGARLTIICPECDTEQLPINVKCSKCGISLIQKGRNK